LLNLNLKQSLCNLVNDKEQLLKTGILFIDKPVGPTSFDVVRKVRKALQEKKVGHTGTLDPFATGLLPICVGQGTRIVQYLTDLDKTYEATLALGMQTNTGDHTGETILSSEVPKLDSQIIESAMQELAGESMQMPPQFSAKKVNGVPAYKMARRGEHVELVPRAVLISDFKMLHLDEAPHAEIKFRVRVSKGTYIRVLGEDLAKALGTCGHLTQLRRTLIGELHVDTAVALDDIEDKHLQPIAAGLTHLPSLILNEDEITKIRFGQKVAHQDTHDGCFVAKNVEGDVICIAECDGHRIKPLCVFN
jgi:tRNA pseudouridine55 synthase